MTKTQSNNPSSADQGKDVLSRIREVEKAAQETRDLARETANQISYVGRVFQKIGAGFSWINGQIIEPVLGVIPFTKPLWKSALAHYEWFCYPSESFPKAVWRGAKNAMGRGGNSVLNFFRTDKKEFVPDSLPLGDFSKTRAGIAALGTAFALSPVANTVPIVKDFVPDIISDHAIAVLYEPPYDATRMAITAAFNGGQLHHETIYLNGKNEIDPKNDVWSVGGCEGKPDCSNDDAVSFRIKPSLMHQAWSFSTGRGPFLPDYVAVPIPNVPSKCDVISYGLRWRVSKWLNSYPSLLDARCESLPMNAHQNGMELQH